MNNIKQLTIQALPELIELERKYFSSSWSYLQFAQWIQQDSILAYGYFSPNLLGYVTLSLVCGEAEVINIAVKKELRRQSIGSQLLGYALTSLFKNKENLCTRVFLEVREHNIPALRLYQKFAFKKIAIRKNYYSDGENALVMECTAEKFLNQPS